MNPRTNLRERDAVHDGQNPKPEDDAARTQHLVLEEGPVRVPRRSYRRELIPRLGWQGHSGGVGGFVVLLFATAFRGGRGLVRHIGVARVRLQGLASHGLLCVSLCLAHGGRRAQNTTPVTRLPLMRVRFGWGGGIPGIEQSPGPILYPWGPTCSSKLCSTHARTPNATDNDSNRCRRHGCLYSRTFEIKILRALHRIHPSFFILFVTQGLRFTQVRLL